MLMLVPLCLSLLSAVAARGLRNDGHAATPAPEDVATLLENQIDVDSVDVEVKWRKETKEAEEKEEEVDGVEMKWTKKSKEGEHEIEVDGVEVRWTKKAKEGEHEIEGDGVEVRLTKKAKEEEEKEIDASAKEKAMEKLQEVFGLGDPPPRHHRQVPPQFMTELYKTIADPSGVTRGKNPFDATVVRSFIERDNSLPHFFSFNISGLDTTEEVLEAELHLYRMRSTHTTASFQPFSSPHYLIRVFQVVNESRLGSPDIHRLLNVHYVGAHESGWQVFNVKAAVLAWVTGVSPNLGLLVTSSTVFGDAADIRFARRDEHHNSKQPILVLFDGEGKVLPEPETTPAPNPLANYPNYYKYQSDDLTDDVEPETSRRRRSPPPHNHTAASTVAAECSRRQLYVDFAKIGWASWIISPKGYSAYHCQGHCHFPLGQGQKPTNHATVQSIVHELQLDKEVGKPCCVPTNLLAISILFYDDNDNVILRNYEDMVAESCGCH